MHHDEKKARKDKAVIMLSALTIMWGTTFAITQNALADVSPILFAAMRFGLAYVIYIAFSKAARDSIHIIINPKTELERDLRHKSVVLGIALGMGYVLQFVGLETTTTSKSAFLTSTTVVWTPMLAILITKHVLNLPTIFAIITCLIGIVLLTHPFPVEEIVIGVSAVMKICPERRLPVPGSVKCHEYFSLKASMTLIKAGKPRTDNESEKEKRRPISSSAC